MESINFNETFWVGISFFLLIALLWKFGIFKFLGASLDNRADAIRSELDEARKLKDEAQALLASYQRKQRKAEEEAQNIIQHAIEEAKLLLKEAQERLESEIQKRTELATHKIAQAEAAVIAQIRDNAIDITVSAARSLILENIDKDVTDGIMEKAMDNIGRKFH